MIKIIIGIAVGVVLLGIILFFVLGRRKKNIKFDYDKFIGLLGGRDNIEDASFNVSRLTVVLTDKSKIQREGLMEMGASAIVVNSKKVTLVMGVLAEHICAYILKK